MTFTVRPADLAAAPLHVDAEEHRVEGGFHVFRRTTTVMGRPRTIVTLRLPVSGVRDVTPAATAPSQG